MIGLSRLIRAIADVPKGGMQTGSPKVVLKLADAERNAELTEERDALAAQVEALRSAIEPFATGGVCSAIDREDYSIMRERIKDWHGAIEFKKAQDAYNSTPQQCLRDVQAEAIDNATTYLAESIPDKSHESVIFKDRYVYISTRYLREYAESVRQGGAA